LLAGLLLAGCACGAPRTTIPEASAFHFATPPAIDGDLGDWASVPRSERFVDTMTGMPADLEAYARFGWDDAYLYAAVEIADPRLEAPATAHDDHLWEHDCAELMIDPEGDGLAYVELQIAPNEVVFDTLYDARRQPQPFGHLEYTSGLEPHVHARGTVNDDANDDGYVVEMRIPWRALAVGPHPVTGPPAAGDTWHVAVYALDTREGGVFVPSAWSPPLEGDFHVPARFGRVTFRP